MAYGSKTQPTYDGAMARNGEGYSSKPEHAIPAGLESGLNANEHGLSTEYITKKGMCYGENAKLNHLPPGQNLFAQDYSDLDRTDNMKFKELVDSKGFQHGGN